MITHMILGSNLVKYGICQRPEPYLVFYFKKKIVILILGRNLILSNIFSHLIVMYTGKQCEPLSSTCNNRSQNCVGFGPGKDMFESTDIIARRQMQGALKAYNR